MGHVLLFSKQKQRVNPVLPEPWLHLGRRQRSLPGCQSAAAQAQDVVHEWEHSLPSSSHASLSLGALILRCCPLPGTQGEAASVLTSLCSSSLAKQKARFTARFSAESTNLK